jgi:dTDP-4-dehydrorhamnose reductase
MRLLINGGAGVLGRALRPLGDAAGHEFAMPGREELDLFDPTAVADAVPYVDGVLHLATRIRSLEQLSDPEACAVTASVSRPSASPKPPDGTRRRRFVT